MRFSTQIAVNAALAVSTASAYSLADLPSCALKAASSGISDTGCATTDYHCLCSASSFLAALQGQIVTVCSASDIQKTLIFAQGVCSSVGITISLPGSTPQSSSSASSASPVNDYASATSTAPDASMTSSTSSSSSSTTSSPAGNAGVVTTPTVSQIATTSTIVPSISPVAASTSPQHSSSPSLPPSTTSFPSTTNYPSTAALLADPQLLTLSPSSYAPNTSPPLSPAATPPNPTDLSPTNPISASTSTTAPTNTHPPPPQMLNTTPSASNHSANTTVATKAPVVPFEGNAAGHGRLRWTGAALLVGAVGAWAVL